MYDGCMTSCHHDDAVLPEGLSRFNTVACTDVLAAMVVGMPRDKDDDGAAKAKTREEHATKTRTHAPLICQMMSFSSRSRQRRARSYPILSLTYRKSSNDTLRPGGNRKQSRSNPPQQAINNQPALITIRYITL